MANTRDEQRALLAGGTIRIEGRVTASSNQALLVSVTLEGESALACYKCAAGERRLWDFPEGLWQREIAAYELDVQLGTDLIPTTVGRRDAPLGPGSLQWWVRDNGEDHYFTLRERPEFHDWFARVAAFDVVANNADRKAGHVLYDDERLWAIDHGLCFHEHDKLRTVIWEYAGRTLDDALRERVERFASGDGGALAHWLTASELAATQARARELVEAQSYPVPDETTDWPPYPWPLI